MAWLYAPFRSDIAIVEGRGAVGPSGTLSSMGRAYTPDGLGRSPTPVLPCAQDSAHAQAAMSPMDGFTRVPLGPAAPRPSR